MGIFFQICLDLPLITQQIYFTKFLPPILSLLYSAVGWEVLLLEYF